MKFIPIVLIGFIFLVATAMEVELYPLQQRDKNQYTAIPSEDDQRNNTIIDLDSQWEVIDTNKTIIPDPCGLYPDFWGVMCCILSSEEILNLSYVSKYFHNFTHPYVQSIFLDNALRDHCVPIPLSPGNKFRYAYILARQLSKLTKITQGIQKIPRLNDSLLDMPSRSRSIILSKEEEMKHLLNFAQYWIKSPLFKISNGDEYFTYLKGVYDSKSEAEVDQVFQWMQILFRDPIVVGAYTIIIPTIIGLGVYSIMSKYWSRYDAVYTGFMQNQTIMDKNNYFFFYNTFSSVFQQSYPRFCQSYNWGCYDWITGNTSDWLRWLSNTSNPNISFLTDFIAKLPQFPSTSDPYKIYNCSYPQIDNRMTCAWGDSYGIITYDTNLDTYVKSIIGANSYNSSLAPFVSLTIFPFCLIMILNLCSYLCLLF